MSYAAGKEGNYRRSTHFQYKKTKISFAMLLKSKFKKYSCESDTGSGLKARLEGTVKEKLKGVWMKPENLRS